MTLRIGIGHDIHKFQDGLTLTIGAVVIPHTKGLLGHSDADALIHAIMDAILGALALDDIGKHFPDSDPRYKGISSAKLLTHVMALAQKQGYEVGNLDCTVHCEKPKLSPFRGQIISNLASLIQTAPNNISVKFGTNEGCDSVGKEEAIICQAIVLMKKIQ